MRGTPNAHPREEIRQISVKAYRDRNGNPCCARDFTTGAVCAFYRTHRFGTGETCVFMLDGAGPGIASLARRGAAGSLIPCPKCPVWADTGGERPVPQHGGSDDNAE